MRPKKRKPPKLQYVCITQSATNPINGIAALFYSTKLYIFAADAANCSMILLVCALAFTLACDICQEGLAEQYRNPLFPKIYERVRDGHVASYPTDLSTAEIVPYLEKILATIDKQRAQEEGERGLAIRQLQQHGFQTICQVNIMKKYC